ncbi:hypothetical protein NDJ32_18535, partial [Acinetobacter baumannii]|nr:hypothetical protein [Acinetobacter baumannii]
QSQIPVVDPPTMEEVCVVAADNVVPETGVRIHCEVSFMFCFNLAVPGGKTSEMVARLGPGSIVRS